MKGESIKSRKCRCESKRYSVSHPAIILNARCVPGVGDTVVNKTDKNSCSREAYVIDVGNRP